MRFRITSFHAALLLACALAGAGCVSSSASPGHVAAKPLYRDPVYDGAADPVLVWNPLVRRWWMFYTNRRANVAGLDGVTWVHGTRIGIAESSDDGATWTYADTASIVDGTGLAETTHWAPDVIADGNRWHMFLTVVPGVFRDWNHPRTIVHLVSEDLRHWHDAAPLALPSDRVIDAAVLRLDDGTWRLWYNDERDAKSIHVADSRDLATWTDRGKAVSDERGEGPKVFRWQGAFWMVTDVWHGLAVYRSDDALQWTRQPGTLLGEPGTGVDDGVMGGHPDVVVSGERAFVFYFTHPGRRGLDARGNGIEQRRSSIQVVELMLREGVVSADRNGATHVRLVLPPRR